MTDREIQDAAVLKNGSLQDPEYPRVSDLSDLCELISLISTGSEWLEKLNYKENLETIRSILSDFTPRKILHEGRMYLEDELMKALGEDFKSPIKKFLRSVFLTSKYLSGFKDLESFQKKFRELCRDPRSTIETLEGFRSESGIFGMHLSKAADIFLLSKTLTIPRFTPKIKAFIQKELNLGEENGPIYFRTMRICERSKLDPLKFSNAIEALADNKEIQ